jgi:hypothetical protein
VRIGRLSKKVLAPLFGRLTCTVGRPAVRHNCRAIIQIYDIIEFIARNGNI